MGPRTRGARQLVDIRRAADRAVTTTPWLESKHSFSFGDYYDPANTHHGLLLVNNDDVVAPATGFDTYPHRDMEIVTWVLSGSLAHKDSAGNSGVIHPGLAQRMSAGTGIMHSEKNESSSEPVHFVQMWVVPDEPGVTPGYQQQEVDIIGELVPIASGRADDAAVTIHNRHATLHGARLNAGEMVDLPHAPYLHLFLTRGGVTLEGAGALADGDAVRLTASGGQRVTATAPSEVLVWEMHPGWQRNAALVAAIALIAGACSTPRSTTPTTPAAPAQAPAGLVSVTVQVDPAMAHAPFDVAREALVPPGWTMKLWARVPKARLAAWTPDGALLVSVPAEDKVVKLTPGAPPHESVLLEGLDAPHGLAFAGSTLYVAESDQVDAYTYADGSATGRRVVADGLPDDSSPELHGAYEHALKSVAVGADGAVYFSIGSTGNVSAEDRSATPERATIMRIPPQGGPYEVFARGVRNGTGLAIAPDGSVWTAVNNRDNIADPNQGPSYGRVIQGYVDDHPAESMARLTAGRDLGWPYCNPDGVGGPVPLVRDVQTNPDGSKLDCSKLPAIEQTLGAHSAPLGLSFVAGGLPAPYAQGALVGVHGSWNRQTPRAPEVSFFPWQNGTLGDQHTLVGGFQAPDGSRWGRPVAAVLGPDGAVYVTDDDAGAVYRVAPPGR